MMYQIRINTLADKIGVHRNTIRNWVNQGRLEARPATGKGLLIEEEEFGRLAAKYGISPGEVGAKWVASGRPSKGGGRQAEEKRSPDGLQVRIMGPRTDRLRPNPQWGDVCLTCGSCASACPIAGVDGLDPRKAVRMVVLGLENELIDSQWPWKCTLCGKCEEACPMNVEIVAMFRRVRGLRDRDKVPSPMHKGVLMDLAKGNNLGIPKDDFLFLLEEMGGEMVEEGRPGFHVPVDKRGANVMVTVNSKEPFAEPDDMKHWWKIFHAAGEDWTIPADNWEGVNWALFTGDDENMKTLVGRIVENMYRLECKTLLLPE
jgi:heterodisulfide reductase subunit C